MGNFIILDEANLARVFHHVTVTQVKARFGALGLILVLGDNMWPVTSSDINIERINLAFLKESFFPKFSSI